MPSWILWLFMFAVMFASIWVLALHKAEMKYIEEKLKEGEENEKTSI